MKSGVRFLRKYIAWLALIVAIGCETPSLVAEAGKSAGTETGEAASAAKTAEPKPAAGGEKPAAEKKKTVDFVREIKPLLEDRCVMCHNRKILPKRVSFENGELALKGDGAGSVIVPGNAEGSRIIAAVSSPETYDKVMPPVSHRLTVNEVDLVRKWIDEGAEWPKGPEGQLKSDKVPAE